MPEFTCYPISADEFNIDFKKTDEDAIFRISIDGEEKINQRIENKTYTIKYDFISNLAISIEKGTQASLTGLSPEQLRRNISLIGNDRYYIRDGKLICNGEAIVQDIVNLYDNYALKSDGTRINILTKQAEAKNDETQAEIVDTKPLYSYNYDGNNIVTYGTYSIVNDIIKAQTYFVKNNKLSIIDDSVSYKIGNLLIDSYNGNEYQTILGTDGKLMDLKQQIKYPKNFYNSDIKEVTTNILEDKKDILVMYNNGKVLNFEYTSGEQEFEEGEKTDIGLLDYLKENLFNPEQLYSELKEKYDQTMEIQQKLEQTPIEEVLKNSSKESNQESSIQENSTNTKQNQESNSNSYSSSYSKKYTTVYNANTKEYDIYQEDEVLNNEEEKVQPITDIIKTTDVLSKFYMSQKVEKVNDNNKNGIIYFGLSIVAIGIALILLNRTYYKNKKTRTKEKK